MKINAFKKEKKVLNFFKSLIVSIVLGMLITLGVSLLCGYKYKIVVTGSMYPTLVPPTLVIIAPVKYDDLKVGDIVNWSGSSGNLTYTHRIVEFNEDGLAITKGDANPSKDGPLRRERYNGKVIANLDFAGKCINYLKANIFFVGLILIYLFLMYIILM